MRESAKQKRKPEILPLNAIKKHEEPTCYVLITCGQPTADGKLSVEMTYEGDPTLAAYLLQSAQGFIEDDESFSH